MKTLRMVSILIALVLTAGCAKEGAVQNRGVPVAASVLEEDQEVLKAALLSLLKHEEFGYEGERRTRTNIILVSSSPEKFGIAEKHQVEGDIDRRVPKEEFESFEARNRVEGTYDSKRASYTSFAMSPPIFIYDDGERFSERRFDRAFPNARGWWQPYLPGYSQDGKRAFVRGWMGPWAHAATYTALLEKKRNGGWKVVWEKLAFYL